MVGEGGHHFKVDCNHHLILRLGPQIAKYSEISTILVGICSQFLWVQTPYDTEMEKHADSGDASVLFFPLAVLNF